MKSRSSGLWLGTVSLDMTPSDYIIDILLHIRRVMRAEMTNQYGSQDKPVSQDRISAMFQCTLENVVIVISMAVERGDDSYTDSSAPPSAITNDPRTQQSP